MNRVFVYGTLKQGFSNHGLLRDAVLLSDNSVVTEKHLMLSSSPVPGHGIPFVVPSSDVPDMSDKFSVIYGEQWAVNDEQLARLDILESHPSWYERKKVIVRDLHTQHISDVWLYFMAYDRIPAHGHIYVIPNGTFGDTDDYVSYSKLHNLVAG